MHSTSSPFTSLKHTQPLSGDISRDASEYTCPGDGSRCCQLPPEAGGDGIWGSHRPISGGHGGEQQRDLPAMSAQGKTVCDWLSIIVSFLKLLLVHARLIS